MITLNHITLKEFEALARTNKLSSDTRLTVIVEDEQAEVRLRRRQQTQAALQKLRGSGNGRLMAVLLQERQTDQWP